MATTITINGSVTLDESSGLQNSGIPNPVSGEDNNDSDVSLATLQSGASTFYNRLFNSAPGGLGLSTTFASSNGVAESASNFIQVSGGTVVALGFVDGNGGALPVYAGVPSGGVATGLSALNGGAISLFADATLGNRMVLGVDANNDIVFAIFMDPNAALTSARVWMVQFEAISNPNANNPDDSVNLFDSIGVAASTTLSFNFDQLHSGSNLFGTVGDAANALNVIAEHPVLAPDGTLVSSPNGVIKTSQGGTGATIGVNSQMFDPNEGAYFTYLKSPVTDFLGANLSQTEANNSADIQYTGGTLEVTGASTTISQIQGNSLGTMKITAYDIGDAPQGTAFVNGPNGLGTGTHVDITSVHVFNAAGTDVTSGKVSISGGVATVSSLDSGFKIAWTTSAVSDRVLIQDVAGKFDIGAFGITQAQPTPDQKLDFVARATDGDGDFKTASFSIGIDGTGINPDGHVAGVG